MGFNITQPMFWMVVIGGLGLFIYGIYLISDSLKKIAGTKLRGIIDKCSSNRFTAFLTGAGFTAAIHSSGATSSLAIGLVRANAMTLVQAIAIIIGANIGTTITSLIISIPIAEYMAPFLFVGALIVLLVTRKKFVNIGNLIFSLGAIFFGILLIEKSFSGKETVDALSGFFTFLINNPWLGFLIGIVVTALLQSSGVVVGIVQGIYAAAIIASKEQGAAACSITLFGVLPIIFGSNIGSTSTALLSCIGGCKDAKRVAVFHLFFNTTIALICMGLIYPLKPVLDGSPNWAIDAKLQIALSHLIFNGFGTLVYLPLVGQMAKLLCKIIPGNDRRNSLETIKELDKGLLKQFPSEGISLAKDATETMFKYTKVMFESIDKYLDTPKQEEGIFVHDVESSIDMIDRNLNEYLLEADKGELGPDDLKVFTNVLRGSKDIERIGDYAENIISFYENATEKHAVISKENKDLFKKMTSDAINIITDTIEVFKNGDDSLCRDVIQKRRDLNNYLDDTIANHFTEIKKDNEKVNYIDLVYVDIINAYQRVYSHCSDIAKLFARDKDYSVSNEEMARFNSLADRY